MRKRSTSNRKKRALVTGGAGFIGSHLCETLLSEGYAMVCMDNLDTASAANTLRFEGSPNFGYVKHEVTLPTPVNFGHHAATDKHGRCRCRTELAGVVRFWREG